jgi:hypothetical protein
MIVFAHIKEIRHYDPFHIFILHIRLHPRSKIDLGDRIICFSSSVKNDVSTISLMCSRFFFLYSSNHNSVSRSSISLRFDSSYRNTTSPSSPSCGNELLCNPRSVCAFCMICATNLLRKNYRKRCQCKD